MTYSYHVEEESRNPLVTPMIKYSKYLIVLSYIQNRPNDFGGHFENTLQSRRATYKIIIVICPNKNNFCYWSRFILAIQFAISWYLLVYLCFFRLDYNYNFCCDYVVSLLPNDTNTTLCGSFQNILLAQKNFFL